MLPTARLRSRLLTIVAGVATLVFGLSREETAQEVRRVPAGELERYAEALRRQGWKLFHGREGSTVLEAYNRGNDLFPGRHSLLVRPGGWVPGRPGDKLMVVPEGVTQVQLDTLRLLRAKHVGTDALILRAQSGTLPARFTHIGDTLLKPQDFGVWRTTSEADEMVGVLIDQMTKFGKSYNAAERKQLIDEILYWGGRLDEPWLDDTLPRFVQAGRRMPTLRSALTYYGGRALRTFTGLGRGVLRVAVIAGPGLDLLGHFDYLTRAVPESAVSWSIVNNMGFFRGALFLGAREAIPGFHYWPPGTRDLPYFADWGRFQRDYKDRRHVIDQWCPNGYPDYVKVHELALRLHHRREADGKWWYRNPDHPALHEGFDTIIDALKHLGYRPGDR